VIDHSRVSTSEVDWPGACRIIRSRFPPIDVFDDIADPADWPRLLEAPQNNNQISRDRPSRFSDGRYGVLYAARAFETALMETVHHHARFMARTDEPPGWTSQFREILLDVAAVLHDLRKDDAAFAPALLPDDYAASQQLGATLRAGGSDGIAYPSQRHATGECVGLFYPDRARNPVQGRHLDYHWNGSAIDFYRDAGRGEVYRIS
jgi:hypothetical protein